MFEYLRSLTQKASIRAIFTKKASTDTPNKLYKDVQETCLDRNPFGLPKHPEQGDGRIIQPSRKLPSIADANKQR